MKFKIIRYRFLLWEEEKWEYDAFPASVVSLLRLLILKVRKKTLKLMTSSATADSGLCVSLPTDHQHNPYFMNLVNSSDDDQDGLWFILPLLC